MTEKRTQSPPPGELIDFNKHADDWVGRSLLAMVVAGEDRTKKEVPMVPGEGIRVEVRINGVAVNYSDLIQRLSEEYERAVRQGALEMVEEKFSELMRKLEDFENVHSSLRRKLGEELGLETEGE